MKKDRTDKKTQIKKNGNNKNENKKNQTKTDRENKKKKTKKGRKDKKIQMKNNRKHKKTEKQKTHLGKPNPHYGKPGVHHGKPHPHQAKPHPGHGKPGVPHGNPHPHHGKPGVHHGKPQPHHGVPHPHHGKPQPHHGVPHPHHGKPKPHEGRPEKKQPLQPCRKGFTAVGTKCYKLVKEKMDWQTAAVNCGADNAGLARYDNEFDKVLEAFFEEIRERKLNLQTSRRVIKCKAGSKCNLPKRRAGIRVVVKDKSEAKRCKGMFRLSKNGRKLIVKKKCNAKRFVVYTVDAKAFDSKRPIVAWVGGNTNVLEFGERKGRTPFQVDPLRLLNPKKFKGQKGCFEASHHKGKVLFRLNKKCTERLLSICEYDNTVDQKNNTPDFVVIKKKVTHDQAVVECNKKKRSLVSIYSKQQQERVHEVIKDLRSDVWISAKYDTKYREFRWADDTPMTFTNWQNKKARHEKHFVAHHYASVFRWSGKWETRRGMEQFFPLCGPVEKTPLVFTPFFPVKGTKDIYELKEKLIRLQEKYYVCENPEAVECTAQTKKKGQWVSSNDSKTLVCNKNYISCKRGQELDCSTLRVRFLCPGEKDQCKALKKLQAPACGGGQQCYPVTNHFVCRCPPNHIYNEVTKKCVKFCGECSSWGDPHYTNLRGHKFDFMGVCKYKFTGVCNKKEFKDRPYFDMYTSNVECPNAFRRDGTCLNSIELKLKNIPVVSHCGYTHKKDFVFRVNVREDYYKLNGEKVTDQVVNKEGVYKAVVRNNYFSLVVHSLDLRVFLNGGHLRVQVPDKFRGKLCGLCGDCSTDKYKLRNGKMVDVKMSEKKGWYITDSIIPVGTSWLVPSKEFKGKKCGVRKIKNTCKKEQMDKVSGKNLCGMFFDHTNELNKCFEKTRFNRNSFFYGCVYDLCEMKDPEKGLCNVIKSFVQQCSSKGVTIDWREPGFCPMKCKKGEVYRLDASCEKKCGEEKSAQSQCNEEPAEGCVCKDGLYRLGDKCVPYEQCGCRILDDEGNFMKLLQPGKTLIMPGCREIVSCKKNLQGKLYTHFMDYDMPANSVCTDGVPPKVRCARGFRRTKKNKKCIRKIKKCRKGYKDKYNMCIKYVEHIKQWKDSTEYCESKKGTLVFVDTDEKIESVNKIMEKYRWDNMRVAGKVKAYNTFGYITFKAVQPEGKKGSPDWVNSHFHGAFLDKIVPDECMQPSHIPKDGLEMTIVAYKEGPEVIFKAVPASRGVNFVCEQSE